MGNVGWSWRQGRVRGAGGKEKRKAGWGVERVEEGRGKPQRTDTKEEEEMGLIAATELGDKHQADISSREHKEKEGRGGIVSVFLRPSRWPSGPHTPGSSPPRGYKLRAVGRQRTPLPPSLPTLLLQAPLPPPPPLCPPPPLSPSLSARENKNNFRQWP